MKKFPFPASLLTLLGPLLAMSHLEGADLVRVDPAPSGEPLSTRFTVSVEKENAPVYLATIMALAVEKRGKPRPKGTLPDTGEAGFASFDIAGPVEVTVTCPEPIQTAKLLPSSSGIKPVVSGNSVTFTMTKPGQLTLEVNGDWVNSLELFANPMETDIPSPTDPNVIYYGPGVHVLESVKVDSGKTVYLAGGAVIYGNVGAGNRGGPVFDLEGSNITLRGRGIIDGSRLLRAIKRPHLIIAHGTNIQVEGVILRNSPSWNFPVRTSEQVSIRNIKIFGWRGNSDGIDICNSRHVEVSDCFLRTYDDLVVIKSDDTTAGETGDITVKNCVLWNELAHALSLGAELRAPVENVLFTNCDIIHDKGVEWDLRVYDCDSSAVKNIVFDNIRIEESRRLFSLWIGKNPYSQQAERGHIDDITFRNITAVLPEHRGPFAALTGFDAEHAVQQVLFDQVRVGGRPLQSSDVKQNAFVQDVSIRP